MNWAQVWKRLNLSAHVGGITADSIIERFTWCGIDCFLAKGVCNANGYVVMPERVARRVDGLDLELGPFEAHGGITYHSGQTRQIGFDTGHAGDWWTPGDMIRYSYAPDDACAVAQSPYHVPPPRFMRIDWTLDRVRVETRALAEQVAALNYVVPWRAEHRAMRRRLQSARKERGK